MRNNVRIEPFSCIKLLVISGNGNGDSEGPVTEVGHACPRLKM